MPSRESMAIRKSTAFEELNESLGAIAKRLDIDIEPVAAQSKDPELLAVLHIEQMRDAAEAIEIRLAELRDAAAEAERDQAAALKTAQDEIEALRTQLESASKSKAK